MSVRDELLALLWDGKDPFAEIDSSQIRPDRQGWKSGHPYLSDGVASISPRITVEIGVWKGMSTITLARGLRDQNIDGAVIAVDTWLGAWDHWINPKWRADLHMRAGFPTLQSTFMSNVIHAGLQNYIIPLPLDSVNAANVLRKLKITPNLVHIDGGHDYRAVKTDIEEWWPMISPGGMLIGDDYGANAWPDVTRAFDDYFRTIGLFPMEHERQKCRVKKPENSENRR